MLPRRKSLTLLLPHSLGLERQPWGTPHRLHKTNPLRKFRRKVGEKRQNYSTFHASFSMHHMSWQANTSFRSEQIEIYDTGVTFQAVILRLFKLNKSATEETQTPTSSRGKKPIAMYDEHSGNVDDRFKFLWVLFLIKKLSLVHFRPFFCSLSIPHFHCRTCQALNTRTSL